jgi:hypothetical protein
MKMLNSQECDAIIVPSHDWRQLKEDETVNTDCRPELIGQPLANLDGGWMTSLDIDPTVPNMCHGLLSDVLRYHFLKMDMDGTLRAIKKTFYDKKSTKQCGVKPEKDPSLNLEAMSGIIIVHGVGLVVAIFAYSARAFQRVKHVTRRRSTKGGGGPCANQCGYSVTWHPTHCCDVCADVPGLHGEGCAKKECQHHSLPSAFFGRQISPSTEHHFVHFCAPDIVPTELQKCLMVLLKRSEKMSQKSQETDEKLQNFEKQVMDNFAELTKKLANTSV